MAVGTFIASGKLLLFGEYLVLRGAPALVMPIGFGQRLTVHSIPSENITWECYEHGQKWLETTFTPKLEIIHTSDVENAQWIRELLLYIRKENPSFNISAQSLRFDLDFKRSYGFGSSSTLLSLLGQWASVNPFEMQDKLLGGSGFDVAAAAAQTLFVYRRFGRGITGNRLSIPVNLVPEVTHKLLFVYSGKKQESQPEVASFRDATIDLIQLETMEKIVTNAHTANQIEEWESSMTASEQLISGILNSPPVKKRKFSDYPYAIKSLGAWGGDFIMATFRDEEWAREYFLKKGLEPIFNYEQLIRK